VIVPHQEQQQQQQQVPPWSSPPAAAGVATGVATEPAAGTVNSSKHALLPVHATPGSGMQLQQHEHGNADQAGLVFGWPAPAAASTAAAAA
jgi:hypothetical protein